ncbi:hypothetical protein H2204_001818 [Knufia peltigerae]|uniref:Metallo-beta-lactamase domain-containing protein n=1 Tax=Knufia peltigerae TaxID=1002370 RepID=A0AA38YC02_9EURO|nr:hypothetical protein H2204_001818 [Knufia peltigerae]
MIERIHQPDLDIPHSDVTITTKVLDLVTIHGSNCNNLHHPPIEGVEVVRPVPSLSFLLEHHSGQKLLFDLGVPTDLRTLGSEVADRLKKVGHQITVQKDVVDALEEHNIKREDINAVIWSHTHWDHKGNMALFPPSTTLILGPNALKTFVTNGGNSGVGGINEQDINGRKVREIDFDGPEVLRIGSLRAVDYFNDGSLYLLDMPGHSVGHLCALVRTTAGAESTFLFLGGDSAHHCGEVRPSEHLPLPDSILPNPLPSVNRDIPFYPGTRFEDLNKSRGMPAKGPVWRPKWGQDLAEAIRSIGKMQEFDGQENVLLLLAHDSCVRYANLPLFPESINDWHKRGLGRELRWNWIADIEKGLSKETRVASADNSHLTVPWSPQSQLAVSEGAVPRHNVDTETSNQTPSRSRAGPVHSHGGSPASVNRAALSYTGDDHETAGSLGELLKTTDSSQPVTFGPPYLVPGYTVKETPAEELEFLRVKGAFSIPPKDVCDKAVLAYFRNAHPLLPVLDAKSFLDSYSRRGCQGVRLILLWSILHVAASFLPLDVVKRSGFQTKKAMKAAMYQHVKLLYDNNQESDQLVLVQAVLILGYWHPDSQDRFEAWHWTGIAISMSQCMGLHRSSVGDRRRAPLPADRVRTVRRIWWCCLVRDRWLAFIKGRPMRINLEDCDVPFPEPSDVADDLDGIPQEIKGKCLVYSSTVVGELWSKYVRLSILLGRILRLHSKEIWRTDEAQIRKNESELQEYNTALATFGQRPPNQYEQFFVCQVRIHYEAIMIMLFRPYVLAHPKNPVEEVSSSFQVEATQKIRAAANNMNNILEEIMSLDLVEFVSPAIISPLILAMQMHLLDCKSQTRSISRLGHHRLQLCMMFQAELKNTYWGADGAFRLFQQAQEKLARTAAEREAHKATTLVDLSNSTELLHPEAVSTTIAHTTSNDFSPSEMLLPSVDDILNFDFTFADPQDFPINDIDYSDNGSDLHLNSFLGLDEFNEFVETSQAVFPT